MWPVQANVTLRELFLRRALQTEIFDPCPTVIVGNGDTSAVHFPKRNFRSALRKADGRFQAIPKDLLDHIGHPLTAGVVEQYSLFVRHIGNDHDMLAFPLQVLDSSRLSSVVYEENILSKDLAASVFRQATGGEVSRVLHKSARLILQRDL